MELFTDFISHTPFKLSTAAPFLKYLEKEVLQNKFSPDSICGRAKLQSMFPVILCTKTIYNYIDLGLIPVKNIDLPLRIRRRPKKHHCRKNRRILGDSIEQRPQVVNDRQEFGHWEIDTIVGKRKAGEVLLSLDERMTRCRHVIRSSRERQKKVLGKDLKYCDANTAAYSPKYSGVLPATTEVSSVV